jgi:hypothetical protein
VYRQLVLEKTKQVTGTDVVRLSDPDTGAGALINAVDGDLLENRVGVHGGEEESGNSEELHGGRVKERCKKNVS